MTDYPFISRSSLIIWRLLAAYPFAGLTWKVIDYIVGLRMQRFDVWYVEDSDRYLYDAVNFERTTAYESNVAYLSNYMVSVGIEDRWVLRPPQTKGLCVGGSDFDGLLRLYKEADAVLNLCGAQEMHKGQLDSRCLVFLETNSIKNKVKVVFGDGEKIEDLDAYSYLFTYGENPSASDCLVPMECYFWHSTRTQVVLEWWDTRWVSPSNDALTTLAKRQPT